MAGELVPLVLLPRYTTYAGNTVFSTIAMDVTQYESAIVNLWRGVIVGSTTPGFGAAFKESTDQVTWTLCTGSGSAEDPGANTEERFTLTLKKRWFRIEVTLGGADNVASCWAVGFLEERLR